MSGDLWLVVPSRFRGPPASGNGGWTGGALAAHVPGSREPGAAVTVTLRSPPPLDRALAIERDGATSLLRDGATLVAEAVLAGHSDGDAARALDPVRPVEAATAREAEARYAGFAEHPFPACFGCGAAREPGDGLRIFPGPVEPDPVEPDPVEPDGHGRRVAATWTPHPSLAGPPPDGGLTTEEPGAVSLAIAWAALDCIGGWSAGDMNEQAMVLGRMTCAADALPRIGEEHVVVGRLHGTEGRRTTTSATLYDSDGEVAARARHTWVAVEPGRFS